MRTTCQRPLDEGHGRPPRAPASNERGFSLAETAIVAAIILVVAAISLPTLSTMLASSTLRGAMGDLAALFQTGRSLAVKNNKNWWLGFTTASGRLVAFVDDSTVQSFASGGKQVWLPSGFSQVQAPTGCSTLDAPTMWGGSPSTTPNVPWPNPYINFNSRGIPCDCTGGCAGGGTCTAITPGNVYYFSYASSLGSPSVAALSVSPAGRIKTWYCNGTSWGN